MNRRRAVAPASWEQAEDPALAYLLEQMAWHRRAMNRARHIHQACELLLLLTTAGTVVVSALSAPALLTAAVAAVTLFLTGYRQVFGPNDRWVSSGTAWLALQQEAVRYQLLPEGERDATARRELLDRAIEIVSSENRTWVQQRRAHPQGAGTTP